MFLLSFVLVICVDLTILEANVEFVWWGGWLVARGGLLSHSHVKPTRVEAEVVQCSG